MRLKDKNVIITGGASGFGKEIALTFAREGANIIIADLDKAEGAKIADEIIDLNQKALFIEMDVSKKSDVDKMVKIAIEKFKQIDILVNNAGIANFRDIQEISEEQWDKLININLKGTYLCSRSIIEHMIEKESGKIINMASISGVTGRPVGVDYSASKSGIIGITRTLAVQVAKYGVNVNAIAPGPIITPLMEKYFNEETIERLLATIPYKRQGKASDIAGTALFLASEDSDWITGEVINVNGGAFIG